MRKLFIVLSALFLLSTPSHAGLFGRTQPIYNVNGAHVPTTSDETPTLEQVQDAFIRAAEYKRWQVKVIEPGHLVASINVRRHFAEIDVKLTPTQYSINYTHSRELRYDGEKIHRNYNKWIKFLEDRFRENMRQY
ncbi:MAG: hypothetical protein PVF65_02205 [Sphingomonadales bacterium]|jgi:hypothetical protein